MSPLLMLAISFLAIFVFTIFTGRRFGVLGYALAVGYVIDLIFGDSIKTALGIGGVSLNNVSSVLVDCLITILPSIFLLIHGAKYKKLGSKIIGAVFYMIMVGAFLFKIAGSQVSIAILPIQVYEVLSKYSNYIIGVGLIIATLDMFFISNKKSKEKDKEH